MQTELKAVERSTLPEALAEVLTLEWAVQDGEVRKPVKAKPALGDANAEGDADDERSEANGVSGGDVAEGGEPSETAQRTCRQVRWRRRAANGFDVRSALR